ncbi:MAG: hypothetical protein IPM18_08685 [Phycisphaerales bacterium]|nr:hypothetical protein [Phycisphaerales bacterium]
MKTQIRSQRGRVLIGVLIAAVGCLPAVAAITDINAALLQERVVNFYPGSTLATVNNFPAMISLTESAFGAGTGFANRHDAWFSSDGGVTQHLTNNADAFDISVSVMLDVGSIAPRKEAGFRIGGGLFILTSDGEVAAFGGALPFHTFGNSAYGVGDVATMRVIYRPGAQSTIEYILNGNSSGEKPFGNVENGIIDGSTIGLFGQFQPNVNNPDDFAQLEFRNIQIAVPEPGSFVLLLLAGTVVLARGNRRG